MKTQPQGSTDRAHFGDPPSDEIGIFDGDALNDDAHDAHDAAIDEPDEHLGVLGSAGSWQSRWAVAVLGRFDVQRDGQTVVVPTGLPDQAVKFIAVRGGRVRADELIDVLWPDASPDVGRKGMRNLMSRLQQADCPVLEREGDAVQLPRGTWVDALAFQTVADRVLLNIRHPGAAEGARLALDHYRGDLLEENLYWDWVEEPRERLRRRRVALLDLLVTDARRRGSMAEVVTLMEMAIEAQPYDDLRYLEVAETLIEMGRRGRAARYIHRAKQVLLAYGLEPSSEWGLLQRQLQQADQRHKSAESRPESSTSQHKPSASQHESSISSAPHRLITAERDTPHSDHPTTRSEEP